MNIMNKGFHTQNGLESNLYWNIILHCFTQMFSFKMLSQFTNIRWRSWSDLDDSWPPPGGGRTESSGEQEWLGINVIHMHQSMLWQCRPHDFISDKEKTHLAVSFSWRKLSKLMILQVRTTDPIWNHQVSDFFFGISRQILPCDGYHLRRSEMLCGLDRLRLTDRCVRQWETVGWKGPGN